MTDLSQERLLNEYHAWVFDGKEKSTMPASLDNNDNLTRQDFEIFNIFFESNLEPDELINQIIPELKDKYTIYFFDIFQHPIFSFQGKEMIRYNRIIVPLGFIKSFNKLIKDNNLFNHRFLIFHFVAEIADFRMQHYNNWLGVAGLKYIKQIRKEKSFLEKLKFELHISHEVMYDIKSLSIEFQHHPKIKFQTPWVIWYDILHEIEMDSRNSKYKDRPIIEKNFDLPYHNKYWLYFQNKIIKALYQFQKNEAPISKSGVRIPNKLIEFFIDFFVLCAFPFFDSEGNVKDPQDVKYDQMKKSIQRAIKE